MYKFMWGNNNNKELYFAWPYKFIQYFKSYFKNQNRPFYRYGEHIELIRFKAGCPGGMSTFRLFF